MLKIFYVINFIIFAIFISDSLSVYAQKDISRESLKISNDINSSLLINFEDEYSGEKCYRECENGIPRICYYKFILEHYQTMGVACGNCSKGVTKDCYNEQCVAVDGIEKGVMTINRQISGPPIHVCKNDQIVVDIDNRMSGSAAAIHWHGFHMRDTPFMDGVPFLTQCPISFSNTFRYKFYATQPGTQFYHSHSGHQKMSGQYGPIVVREPIGHDPNSNAYDFDLKEHILLLSDWMHAYPEMFVPGLPTRGSGITPDSFLINGRGQWINPKTNERTNMPLDKFYVRFGFSYRFRIINSGSLSCPNKFQIENHNFTVIAADSFNVQPKTYSTLITNPGERYDIVINANQTPGNYFIRVTAIGSCKKAPIESFALLSYLNSNSEIPSLPEYNETFPDGIVLNHPQANCMFPTDKNCLTELQAIETDLQLQFAKPDAKFFLGFRMRSMTPSDIFSSNYDYSHFFNLNKELLLVGSINNITMAYPSFPLLTQTDDIDESKYCDNPNIPQRCKNLTVCPCIHRIKVKLNSILEIVVIDEVTVQGEVPHPFHLHGHRFMVVGLGQHPLGIPMTVERAKILDNHRSLHRTARNNPNPPFKDTVTIPSKGYAIVRVRADNPGFWLMHCHFDWHLATGMALIFQVGEIHEMVKPPSNFPKCNNFIPEI